MRRRTIDNVRQLLERLDSLSEDDLWLLADLWEAEDSDARRAAWSNVKRAIEGSGNQRTLNEARDTIAEWMRADPSDYQGIQGLLGQPSGESGVRQAAAPALIDAAAAMLTAEHLDETELSVLMRPWRGLDEADEAAQPAE